MAKFEKNRFFEISGIKISKVEILIFRDFSGGQSPNFGPDGPSL